MVKSAWKLQNKTAIRILNAKPLPMRTIKLADKLPIQLNSVLRSQSAVPPALSSGNSVNQLALQSSRNTEYL